MQVVSNHTVSGLGALHIYFRTCLTLLQHAGMKTVAYVSHVHMRQTAHRQLSKGSGYRVLQTAAA